MMFSKNRSFSV